MSSAPSGVYINSEEAQVEVVTHNTYVSLDDNQVQKPSVLSKVIRYGGWVVAAVLTLVTVAYMFRNSLFKENEDVIDVAIFSFNDIYEIVPVGGYGGVARVATYKKEIEKEFPDAVISILPGDFLSPSALSTAVVPIDDKEEKLNGRQMVDVLNALKIDLATYGNHEFDIPKDVLLSRLSESTFKYISTNVKDASTGDFFPNSVPSVFITKKGLTFAFLSISIDTNLGAGNYADIPKIMPSIQLAKDEIAKWKKEGRTWDFLVAITHVNLESDVTIVQNIPEIDLILGGHEHQNWYINRGTERPVYITKADSNVKTVYTHRIRHYPKLVTRKVAGQGTAQANPSAFSVESELRSIDSRLAADPAVNGKVAFWWDFAKRAFSKNGFDIDKKMAFVGEVGFDITEKTMRHYSDTPFGLFISNSYYNHSSVGAHANNKPSFAFFNSGSIRIDDYVRNTMTQYDILRILPFGGNFCVAEATGSVLKAAFMRGMSIPGNGSWMCSSDHLQCDTSSKTCKLYDQLEKKFVDFNDDEKYIFTTVDYVCQGGDNYWNPDQITVLQTDFPVNIQEALRESFETIYPYHAQETKSAMAPASRFFGKLRSTH